MVARELWSDTGPTKIQRSRTRDLSRQFRGEKAIEWRVIEVYVTLLFPGKGSDTERSMQLEHLRPLHAEAFGSTVDPDGQPAQDKPPAIDPAYVAELTRQLEEARTRASFATALLVIVQAENSALRGRGRSFDWFGPEARSGPEESSPERRPESGAGAEASAAAHRSRRRAATTAGSGGHVESAASASGEGVPADPATAPISRRQMYRSTQRRRAGQPPGTGEPVSSGPRQAMAPAAPAPHSGYSLAPLTRYRPVPASPRRGPVTDLPLEDLGPDILVGREKRRRGRAR